MVNLFALFGIISTVSFSSIPSIISLDNSYNVVDNLIITEHQLLNNDFNIHDNSLSIENNTVNGSIEIYHGSNRFQYANNDFLDIRWSVNIDYSFDLQLQKFTGGNINGWLNNVDTEEICYYSYELNLNLLNGKQYNTLQTQLLWWGGFFDNDDWFAYIEDINGDEVANVVWSDYYNTTASLDFDYVPFEDYLWIKFYNIWSFSELYQIINTLNSIYGINADDSYASGYNSGYNIGYDDGYDTGYSANVENIASQKYQEGYNKGYDDGFHVNVGDGLSVQNILYSIVTLPSTIIKEGFDFDILGINVGNLIQTALVVGLVVFAVGMFKKG